MVVHAKQRLKPILSVYPLLTTAGQQSLEGLEDSRISLICGLLGANSLVSIKNSVKVAGAPLPGVVSQPDAIHNATARPNGRARCRGPLLCCIERDEPAWMRQA
eukprot:scaffold11966_cov17-Tisochrysis_lutea.AAC.1